MKTRIFLAILLLVAGLQTAWGQGFRVYKSDGTVAQYSLRTDSIVFYDGIGSDQDFGPFTPVNQCIVGTWYKNTESMTFNEDGTTDYINDATYVFLPYQDLPPQRRSAAAGIWFGSRLFFPFKFFPFPLLPGIPLRAVQLLLQDILLTVQL